LTERPGRREEAVGPIRVGGTTGASSPGRLRTFRSFHNRAYRFYFGGMLGQIASMNMQQVANGLLIERLTGSPAITGIMSLANAIPMLALSLLGGVIADRVEKKFMLLLGQAAFALVSLGVAIALTVGYLSAAREGSWWVLVVASGLQGGIMGIAMPARQAMLNDIVSGEGLMNAISLNFMGMNALQLIVPTAAGFLIETLDFKSVYYVMTGLFLMAVVMFVYVPRTGIRPVSKSSAFAEIKGGLRYAWRVSNIRSVLFISFTVVVLSSPWGMLAPFFVDKILHVGAEGMGILLSVSGAGAILASFALASLPNRNRGMILLIGGVFLGLALSGFAFSRHWPLSLILIALAGIGGTVTMTLTNTLVQYYAEDNYRGRVMSLFMMQFGLGSLGNFASGLIGQQFGVQWAVGSFAMLLVLVAALAMVLLPHVRKLN
jgi:MFS family permease